MNNYFNNERNMMHIVKSECLRSLSLKYGQYNSSILGYAIYKIEYRQNGAGKKLQELQNYVSDMNIEDSLTEQLELVISDTYSFIENGIVNRRWTTYSNNIRYLFNTEEISDVKLSYEQAEYHCEDIKHAIEVRIDILLEQTMK